MKLPPWWGVAVTLMAVVLMISGFLVIRFGGNSTTYDIRSGEVQIIGQNGVVRTMSYREGMYEVTGQYPRSPGPFSFLDARPAYGEKHLIPRFIEKIVIFIIILVPMISFIFEKSTMRLKGAFYVACIILAWSIGARLLHWYGNMKSEWSGFDTLTTLIIYGGVFLVLSLEYQILRIISRRRERRYQMMSIASPNE